MDTRKLAREIATAMFAEPCGIADRLVMMHGDDPIMSHYRHEFEAHRTSVDELDHCLDSAADYAEQ
jgi:hypothetical protein